MRKRMLARYCAIAEAERNCKGAATGGKSFKAKRGQHPRRARIPRIGDHKQSRFAMQRLELRRLGGLTSHSRHLASTISPLPTSNRDEGRAVWAYSTPW